MTEFTIRASVRKLIGPLTGLLVFRVSLASPQTDVTELPQLTVVAGPEQTRATDELAQAFANNVTFRTRSELESSQYSNINNFLRGTPGISVLRSSEGRGVGLRVRGLTAAQGVVTFDGVPLLTALPGLSWLDTIPAEALGGIGVVLGSGHAYYSGQGIAGGIHLTSKRALKNYGLAHVEGGSFGAFRTTLSGGLKTARADLSVTGSRVNQFDGAYDAIPSRGNPERDPFGSTLGIARYGARFTPDLSVNGSLLYKDSWLDADLPGVTPTGRPTFVDNATTEFHERLWLTQHTASARLTDKWTTQLQLAYTENDIAARAGRLSVSFSSQLMFADWRNVQILSDDLLRQGSWRLVWGGQARHERGENDHVLLSSPFRDERKTISGFAELQADLGSWHHEAGVRVENHDDYGSHTLLHVGSRWDLSSALNLRANAGTGFRAPSYGELQMPLLGNPALEPEKGLTADVGFDWTPTREFRFSLTGYYGRYNNLLTSQVALGRFVGLGNTPRARIAGAEASIEVLWSERIQSGLDFTYQYSRNLDTDRPLPVHPEKSGRLWTQWTLGALPLNLRVNATYQGSQWNNSAATLATDDTVRVDAIATYHALPRLDLYVRGENITNNRTGGPYARYTQGITVFGGIHLAL
jgi:outer membrane cobalamin receptor